MEHYLAYDILIYSFAFSIACLGTMFGTMSFMVIKEELFRGVF